MLNPTTTTPSIRAIVLNRKGGLILSAFCAALGMRQRLGPGGGAYPPPGPVNP